MPSPRTAAMGLIVFCAAHEKNVYSLLRSMISFCAVGAVITCLKYSVSQNKESKGASAMRPSRLSTAQASERYASGTGPVRCGPTTVDHPRSVYHSGRLPLRSQATPDRRTNCNQHSYG